jgi:hypothetical protein
VARSLPIVYQPASHDIERLVSAFVAMAAVHVAAPV